MASAIRTKVRLGLGAFFGVTGSVVTAVDDDDKDTGLKMVCCGTDTAHAPAGVKGSLTCPVCNNDARATFKRASESGGTYSVLSDEDLERAGATEADKLKIDLNVHKASEYATDALPGGKVYYFQPNKGDESTYALFREMITSTDDLVYVATWAARSKVALYQIRVVKAALVMQQIAWPAAVREAPTVEADFAASDLKMAVTIANAAVTPYDPQAYRDGRKDSLLEAIAKAEGVEGAVVPEGQTATATAPANSLTAMLQQQLAATGGTVDSKPAPKKRTRKPKVAA